MTKQQADDALNALYSIRKKVQDIAVEIHYLSNVDVDHVMLLSQVGELGRQVDNEIFVVQASVVEEDTNG
jgi:hypothetical protein